MLENVSIISGYSSLRYHFYGFFLCQTTRFKGFTCTIRTSSHHVLLKFEKHIKSILEKTFSEVITMLLCGRIVNLCGLRLSL